jgi:hypothetical protein
LFSVFLAGALPQHAARMTRNNMSTHQPND